MRSKVISTLAAILLGGGLAACETQVESAVAESTFRPTASIQEVMDAVVDPAADAIWDAVSTTTTKDGTEVKQPTSDEEWKVLRHQAVSLAEAANLLVIDGRQVAHAGRQLDDSGTPGILTAPEIEKAIAANRPAYVKAAHDLHDTAVAVLAAIDTKQPAAVIAAGGKIERACEHCHVQFWYPNGQAPQAASFAKPVVATH